MNARQKIKQLKKQNRSWAEIVKQLADVVCVIDRSNVKKKPKQQGMPEDLAERVTSLIAQSMGYRHHPQIYDMMSKELQAGKFEDVERFIKREHEKIIEESTITNVHSITFEVVRSEAND